MKSEQWWIDCNTEQNFFVKMKNWNELSNHTDSEEIVPRVSFWPL